MNNYIKPFQQYSDFKGRSSRQEFWIFYLLYVLTRLLCKSLDTLLETNFMKIMKMGY